MIDLDEITSLIDVVKLEIEDDCRAFEDSEEPGIQLTVATSNGEEWSYQTGDNSYTGGAYGYTHWSVVGVYRDTASRELAQEVIDELEGMVSEAAYWETHS